MRVDPCLARVGPNAGRLAGSFPGPTYRFVSAACVEETILRPSLGDIRRIARPIVLKYWLKRADRLRRATRFRGLDLEILPSVFHPKYFGSTSVLASFVEALDMTGSEVLDMGTGSGAIGLIAARSGARVMAVDINPAAVECARANAVSNGLELEVRESDLFETVGDREFDFVIWNPPFFPKEPQNVGEMAFFAGVEFKTLATFARELPEHLAADGKCYLVLSLDIDVDSIEEMFEESACCTGVVLTRRWGLGEQFVVLEASL